MSNESEYARLFQQTRKAFMPYACYGYPDPLRNQRILETIFSNGADALEIGFPFSDPVADGPLLTNANMTALRHRPTFNKLCATLTCLRQKGFIQPITLMMYANTFIHIPKQQLQTAHRKRLLQCILVPDIPQTEIDTLLEHAPRVPKAFLVSDNTPSSVIRSLDQHCPAYYYLTAKYGTTGTDYSSKKTLNQTIQRIRHHTKTPLCAGIGITTTAQARRIDANGIIIGSQLTKQYNDGGIDRLRHTTRQFAATIHRGKNPNTKP